uniref:Uncharacterized protein n=1 Tax=Kalanchoe fedtschenkoi TaxID=63787 RepID=A0A7N0TD47_KALFE
MRLCSGWRPLLLFLPLIVVTHHLFPVELSHDAAAVKNSAASRRSKSDHLILGPAAGQGLPDRLQCQGTKALNKTYFSSSSRISQSDESVTFVTVFSIYNSSVDAQSSKLVTVGNASYNKVQRSMAVLNVYINFIQVAMPNSEIAILTDPESDIPIDRHKVTVYPIRGDYSRDKLMLQRIRSYIAFLDVKHKEHSRGQMNIKHYIFTDSDISVIDDLGRLFHDHPDFHLALTFRNNKEQPLNSGFIAVRGTTEGILRAKEFLQEVLLVYSSKFMKASRMLGDQLALAWTVHSHLSADSKRYLKPEPFIEEIGRVKVLFLPCAIYNWTPPEGAGQFHGMPLNVKVVHFKGSRKRLMLESWNFYQSSTSIPDMLCLILMSGRTKYDF